MHAKKIMLSGSVNGRNIKVVQTATPGTLLHTVASGSDSLDEIFIQAVNTSAAIVLFTVEFGGVTSPDDLVSINLEPYKGAYMVIAGWLLQNGVFVKGFAASANVIVVNGWVNRLYQA